MSWEYTTYRAVCQSCGLEGRCIRGMDDWMRTSQTWEGFQNAEANPTAIGQLKVDRRELSGVCPCGNFKINVLEVIEEEGNL